MYLTWSRRQGVISLMPAQLLTVTVFSTAPSTTTHRAHFSITTHLHRERRARERGLIEKETSFCYKHLKRCVREYILKRVCVCVCVCVCFTKYQLGLTLRELAGKCKTLYSSECVPCYQQAPPLPVQSEMWCQGECHQTTGYLGKSLLADTMKES